MWDGLIVVPLVQNVPMSPVGVGTWDVPQSIEFLLLVCPPLHLG